MPVQQIKHNNDGKFYHIAIDIAKEGAQLFDLTPYVKGRVGDNNFGLLVDWYRQGMLMNVNGAYKPVIDGLVGNFSFDKNGNLKMDDDASPVYSEGKPEDCGPAGQVTYYFPEQMFPKEGIFKGYLGLIDDKGNRYSGVDIWFSVLAGNARMGIACDFYISELEKAIKEAEDDLLNSKKSMQKVVDEFVSKMNDLTNRLETQANTDQTALDALEQKIKQDGLFTQAEADAFKQEINKLLSNAAVSKVRNNKSYTTISDRLNDDEEHQLYLYDSIADMKADDGLAAGMVVQASNRNDGDHITQQFKIGSTPDRDELFVKLANGNYANEITRDRLFPPKIVAQPEMFLASNDIKRQKEIIDSCVYLGYEAFTVDVHLEYDNTNGFHTQEDLSTLCDAFTYAKNLGYPTTALKIHYTGTFDDTTVPAYGSYITSTVIPALKSLNFDKVCVLNERQETVTPWTSKYIPQFIGLVNSIKTYGYKVGISYENDVHIAMGYNNQRGLMQSLDWIGCNLYPTIGAYGNLIGVDDVVAAFDEAMDSLYLITQLGKPIIITETGIRPYPQYFASPSNYGFDDSTNGDYSVFMRYFEGVYRSKVRTVAKEVWDWHMWNDREIPDMARLIRRVRGVI
ncbi:hypothetical protein [Limosilactobacillus reuteri]|uniref:hypothetical protein n=1 Tax=Limosilactobacillus reuteri TaxID=1598 RepID=UPI001EE69B47|nr:hypothetical protein [Limosilactobacillus reuteri]